MSIPHLLTQQSGSVGETVFSRNQHGPYTRDRSVPSDPATAQQLAVRAALSQCVTAWKTTLTGTERRAWDDFAHAVRVRTALGRRTNAGGLGMYIRANVPRIQAAVGGSPRVDQAPTSRTSAQFTPITRVVLNVVDDTLHPFFAESDAWVTETGAAMLFYASDQQPLTRNFWAGPYRFAGSLLGSDPRNFSPGTIPTPFPTTIAHRVFIRARLTRADARLSPAFRLPADTVAQVAPLPISAVFTPLVPPRARVDVTFDAIIRDEPHLRTNWTVRFGNSVWTVLFTSTLDDVVRLTVTNTAILIGPDFVAYAPPPFDVNGLLTGLPVAAFSIPLTL